MGKEKTEYYGFADRENQVFVDEKTVFPACSVSKFITAICIIKLYEQKLINIDMPVNRNPGVDQAESGIEWLVNRVFTGQITPLRKN